MCDNGLKLIKVSLDDHWRTLVGNITNRKRYILTRDHYEVFRIAFDRYVSLIGRLTFLFGDNRLAGSRHASVRDTNI